MKALSQSQSFTATCPKDGTVIKADDLIWHFEFPNDPDAIIDVLTQRVNVRLCPVCKKPVQIVVPLFAFNALIKRGLMVSAGIPVDKLSAQLEQLGSPRLGVDIVHDYEALRLAMLPWLADYLRETLILVVTGGIGLIGPEERRTYLVPLHLRLLRLVADGGLTVALSLPDNMLSKIKKATGKDDAADAVRALIPRQVAASVHGRVIDLYHEAAEANGLQDLYTAVEAALPPDAISDVVLRIFIGDCKPLADVQGGGDFMDAYRAQMVNAIVHACANRVNPQSRAWAEYLRLAWRLSQEGGEPPSSYLPSTSAPKFTRFEDFWDISAGDLAGSGDRTEMARRFDRLRAMMIGLGFEKRLADMLDGGLFGFEVQGADPEELEATAKVLVKSVHDVFLENHSFNISVQESLEMGSIASGLFQSMNVSGQTDSAAELANWLIRDAIEAGDFVAAFKIGCSAISKLNEAQAWDRSVEVGEPLVSKFTESEVGEQLAYAGAHLTVEFWNEVGNTFRYQHLYDAALSSYGIARGFLCLIKDKDTREKDDSVLALNEGRVYRHMGRYGIALQRLMQGATSQPDDAEAHHGLAILFGEINRLDEAFRSINRAITVSMVKRPRGHANMLITRAVIQARLGLAREAAADLEAADRLAPADAYGLRMRIAAAVGFWLANTEIPGDLVNNAENRLWAFIRKSSSATPPSTLVTALAGLGMLLLARGRFDDARRLDGDHLQPFLRDGDLGQWPWELLYLKGRLERKFGTNEESWPWFRATLDALEAEVPSQEDAAFSGTWLADKDAFQAELADLAIDLVTRHAIDASELPRVYEFVNGRSLGARLARQNAAMDLNATIRDRLIDAAKLRGRPIVVFLFVDAGDAVHLVRLSSNDPIPRLVDGGVFPLDRVHAVSERFVSAMRRANPAALDGLDRDLETWLIFADELGGVIADDVPDGTEVCFLPGRHMTALPLHLVKLPTGESLVEKHPVVYAANFALLLNDPSPITKPTSDCLVITVAKNNDTADFRTRLDEEGKRLIKHLEETGRTAHWLDGLDATTKSVVDNLTQSDEVFFLCHGTHGGRMKGYGICLSDGKSLPPPLLPVDDAPDFSRFVLGWDDLEGLTPAPRLVVSVACSSGRIVVAPGGVRLGLEQTLFSSGTRAIVSPLWDVDQEASLDWVDAFQSARQNADGFSSDAHRASCRALKKLYNHAYFWAPFIVSGSLFERTL